MTGWSSATLGVICRKIGSGATPTGGSNAYQEAGIPLIRSQNVLDFSFSEDGLAFINDDQAYELRNVTVEEKDVLLNITGDSVARCCVVPKSLTPARVNQHVAIIRPIPEKASHLFIFYLLQQMKEELLMKSEIGATRRALTKGMLENLEIELPPLPEQKAIAAVLSSLDDKIDLLHRQNQTLEAMAATLFRQWFVEEAQEDWEERPLSLWGAIICGKTPSKSEPRYFGGDIPFIKIPDMHGQAFICHTEDSLSPEGRDTQPKKTIQAGAICVSCIATVGLVSMTTRESQTNQQINSIVPEKDEYRYFLFLFMKSSYDLLHAMASGGTATLNLNTGNFSTIAIPFPGDTLLEDFHKIATPIFQKIFKSQMQIRTLEKLRDNLLPKLMSGEVRVAA